MKVKCPKCGHEWEDPRTIYSSKTLFDSSKNITGDLYFGLHIFGSPEYWKEKYPDKTIPPMPEFIAGDIMVTLKECPTCGKLYWTANSSNKTCGECNFLEENKDE